jgi:hypothetical protein
MVTRTQRNPFESRQRGLTGSVVVFQGQSGTGKSHEATACWLTAGMLFGGVCVALAPTKDIRVNVISYERGYEDQLNQWRGDKRRDGSVERCERRLQFMRNNVLVYSTAEECFEKLAEIAATAEDHGSGRPRFSFLVDEAAVARSESDLLAKIGPLMRNLEGIAYMTFHRGMAIPPQIRVVKRAVVMWRGSDTTGDDELMADIASVSDGLQGGFKYSPVMGDTPKAEQWFRGIRYTPDGPKAFEYNPNLAPRPDWMLLPALPTTVRARVL